MALAGLLALGRTVGAQTRPGWSGRLGADFATGLDSQYGTGSVGATAGVFRHLGGAIALGLDLGYHRLGTTTTRIDNFNDDGSTYREDYTRSLWHATGQLRLGATGGAVRPVGLVGLGVYGIRLRDRIEVKDAAGAPVPFYDFLQVTTDTKPGMTVGAGLELARGLGSLGLGILARWHGILGDFPHTTRTANFLSVGIEVRTGAPQRRP